MNLVNKIRVTVSAFMALWSSSVVLAQEATCLMESGRSIRINTDDYYVLIVDGKYRHSFSHDGMNPKGSGGYTTYRNSKYEYTLVIESDDEVQFIYMRNYRNEKDNGRCIYIK